MIKEQMTEERFSFMSSRDKDFVVQMTEALEALGYTYGGVIVDGICWGKYMLIFRKSGAKSKKVVARIYIRENSVAFRLFLSDITKHSDSIAAMPEQITDAFTGAAGLCRHCHGEVCRFQKIYEINGTRYEKCNGEVFTFTNASAERLGDYIALFREFNQPSRKQSAELHGK